MFSNLGPLFKTTFRQAEQTDTRQAIIREEKEDGRRKKDKKEERPGQDLWEDSTSVSVDALRTFLINFLKGAELTDKLNQNKDQPDLPPRRMPEERTPANTATARALGAYQSIADKVEPHHPVPPPESPPQSDADKVGSSDIRLIHQLIADLEDLSSRGVQTVTIEPAGSFLEALENAVKALK